MEVKKINSVRRIYQLRSLAAMILFILAIIFLTPFFFSSTIAGSLSDVENRGSFPEVKSGDLVFRRSDSLTSQFVGMLDSLGEFSHVGIVFISDEDEKLVVHAFPEKDEHEGSVQVTTFSDFVESASEIAIYRPKNVYRAEAVRAANYAYSLAYKVPFDTAFDLETEDAVYCTELIWRAYLETGIDLVENSFKEVQMPILGVNQYIFPSTLINDEFIELLYP